MSSSLAAALTRGLVTSVPAVATCLLVMLCWVQGIAAGQQRHVIFALIDGALALYTHTLCGSDPRAGAMSDWGSYDVAWREKELGRTPQLKTPVLDNLVQHGAKLDDYYVQHICTPTRQALLSGRYQIHTGLQHGIIQNSQKSCLPPKFGTMADAFKAGGYRTSMIGKWHLVGK